MKSESLLHPCNKHLMKMKKVIFPFLCFLIILLTGCSSGNKTKGYNYEQHRKDNRERVNETRKRNKHSKNLLEHKGKSVKSPKPAYP
jgi:hypothetical protein